MPTLASDHREMPPIGREQRVAARLRAALQRAARNVVTPDAVQMLAADRILRNPPPRRRRLNLLNGALRRIALRNQRRPAAREDRQVADGQVIVEQRDIARAHPEHRRLERWLSEQPHPFPIHRAADHRIMAAVFAMRAPTDRKRIAARPGRDPRRQRARQNRRRRLNRQIRRQRWRQIRSPQPARRAVR